MSTDNIIFAFLIIVYCSIVVIAFNKSSDARSKQVTETVMTSTAYNTDE